MADHPKSQFPDLRLHNHISINVDGRVWQGKMPPGSLATYVIKIDGG